MTTLSYIIDPGGDSNRPGINLQVFPSGDNPLEIEDQGLEVTRLANNELAPADFDFRYELAFETVISTLNYKRLSAVLHKLQNRVGELGQWEIVLYNLAEPFSEFAPARTRYMVPGTTVITQQDMGNGEFYWEYWVAIQGSLIVTEKRQYGAHQKLTLEFTEGTLLTAGMES